MAEQEYNDHFVICLTPRKGTQVICNPDSLRVFFTLVYQEASTIELSKKLEAPKTTIQNRINKLLEKGIIEGRISDDDARSTLYRVCAVPLFIDNNFRPWGCPPSAGITNNMLEDNRQFEEFFVSVFAKHFFESGINIWPLYIECGSSLSMMSADKYREKLDNPERHLGNNHLEGVPDISFDLTYRGEIVMEIDMENTIVRDCTILFGAIMGSMITLLPKVTGYNYCHVAKVQNDELRRASRISISPFRGKFFDDTFPPLDERPDSFYRCPTSFAVYNIEGHSFLIGNKVMLDILDNLADCETVAKLTRKLPYSRISLHSALNKLIGINAVKPIDPDKKRDRIFLLNCKRVMHTREPSLNNLNETVSLLKDGHGLRNNIFGTINTYCRELLDCIGLDVRPIIKEISRDLVLQMRSKLPEMDPEVLLEKLCSHFKDTVSVERIKPGHLVVRPRTDSYNCNICLKLFENILLSELFSISEGVSTKVVCEYSPGFCAD